MNNMMNNMNPLGINNIAMNQMGMNPMIMNNQQNFMNGMNMDENSQNINIIIMQYEIKIRKLEEIIKQKDVEIIALKQKLNNFSNTNFININNYQLILYKNSQLFTIRIN